MKVLRRILIPFAVSFLGIVFLILPAFAATVTLRVPEVKAKTEGTIDVPITAAGASGLSAVHFELIYDPQVVMPDTVSRGPLAGNNTLLDFNAANPGRLLVGLATLDAIKGDGALAIVRFKVVARAAANTALTLDNCRAWESGAHAEVLVKTEAGKVTVEKAFPFFIIAIIAICFVFLLILIIVLVLLSRRRKTSRPVAVQTQSAPAPPVDTRQAFRNAEDEYFRLKGRLSAGHMTHEQFEAAMTNLTIQDAHGRYWTIDRNTGRWLVHNGQTWAESQPY